MSKIPISTHALAILVGFLIGDWASNYDSAKTAKAIINYAATTKDTEAGGRELQRHLEISAITNILVEPGRLSVYGRKGSRIWYYPE